MSRPLRCGRQVACELRGTVSRNAFPDALPASKESNAGFVVIVTVLPTMRIPPMVFRLVTESVKGCPNASGLAPVLSKHLVDGYAPARW